MREYLVDVCNYIDCLFTLVFWVCFIRWVFGCGLRLIVYSAQKRKRIGKMLKHIKLISAF